MSAQVERELKLVAACDDGTTDVDVGRLASIAEQAGFVLAAPSTFTHEDVYLDTPELTLQRAGWALRLRELRGDGSTQRVLGVKAQDRGNGAVLERVEAEEPWREPRPPRTARELGPPLRHRVAPYLLERPLVERMRLATQRTLIPLQCASGAAELCVDRVTVPAAIGPAARFWEIELEIVGASDAAPFLELARALRHELQLAESRTDKLQRALELTGAVTPPAPVTLTGAVPVRTAGFLVFGELFERARRHEPGVRLATNAEEVHGMRVAIRRLREALRVFAPAFPAATLAPLSALAARTGRVLGPLRDIDVMRASVAALRRHAPPALVDQLQHLDATLGEERERVHGRVLRFLERPARLRAMQRAAQLLAEGP